MSVVIYPRLGAVLQAKGLTVPELRHRIKERFGLTVSPKALYVLALDEPVERANLKVVGAAAAALDVTLDDLLVVETTSNGTASEANRRVLGPRESRRLAELFDRQGRAALSASEQGELEELVNRYGHLLHEQRMHELAARQGVPIEQVREMVQAQLNDALAWWQDFEADPARRQAVAEQMKQRGARQAM